MTLNTFTDGINTTFSDELNENFNITSSLFSGKLDLTHPDSAVYLGGNFTVSTGADYEIEDIALNSDVDYIVKPIIKPLNDAKATASGGGATSSNINTFTSGTLSYSVSYNEGGTSVDTATVEITDGSNSVTVASVSGAQSADRESFSGSFIHDSQNYFYYSGTKFDRNDPDLNSPEDQQNAHTNKLDLSSLSTPYYFQTSEVESGDASVTLENYSPTAGQTFTVEISYDGGTSWSNISTAGQVISNESQFRIRINSSSSFEVEEIMLKPVIL